MLDLHNTRHVAVLWANCYCQHGKMLTMTITRYNVDHISWVCYHCRCSWGIHISPLKKCVSWISVSNYVKERERGSSTHLSAGGNTFARVNRGLWARGGKLRTPTKTLTNLIIPTRCWLWDPKVEMWMLVCLSVFPQNSVEQIWQQAEGQNLISRTCSSLVLTKSSFVLIL